MAMAAGLFLEAKDHRRARECAQEALRMAGPRWAGQGRMYALLVEAEAADGRFDRATDAALRLLELDPLGIDARWALVKCYALRGLLDQAWQALSTGGQGQPLDPRSSDETALWVMLGARFSADPHFTGRALALTQRWRDDSDLVGKVLANLHWRAVQPALFLSENRTGSSSAPPPPRTWSASPTAPSFGPSRSGPRTIPSRTSPKNCAVHMRMPRSSTAGPPLANCPLA
ncbi:tetratricopeptide repeat protein [Streptomyces sp. NPDC059153]|uniref:tetratricopeptide repeat protein n=1 Tax=Streptomyces sp. NPDC059153 TaxID=3346743 RepID=UPI00367E703C